MKDKVKDKETSDKNKKIEEPFPPEHTPEPPQIKDPSAEHEIEEKSSAAKPGGKGSPKSKKKK